MNGQVFLLREVRQEPEVLAQPIQRNDPMLPSLVPTEDWTLALVEFRARGGVEDAGSVLPGTVLEANEQVIRLWV